MEENKMVQIAKHLMTDDEVEAKALAEHASYVGKEVLAQAISGYFLNDAFDIVLSPPLRVRVEQSPNGDICRWRDEWLDPVWDVTPVESHPQLANLRSFWVHGTSYHRDGRIQPGELLLKPISAEAA
jgi:hypothetical protein